jgi:hypothetical protein
MRKIILAASASVFGLMVAAAPAAALSSYQIQSDGGANFDGAPASPSNGSISMTTSATNDVDIDPTTGLPVQHFNGQSQQTQQQELSRDMNWQGTGYYLRPSNR